MKSWAVQGPRPVTSGVRFAPKLTPHGPAHAVKSLVASAPHLVGPITSCGTAGNGASEGWPDSKREASGCGPFGVITFGVWQSWHPPNVASSSPRRTSLSAALDTVVGAGGLSVSLVVWACTVLPTVNNPNT